MISNILGLVGLIVVAAHEISRAAATVVCRPISRVSSDAGSEREVEQVDSVFRARETLRHPLPSHLARQASVPRGSLRCHSAPVETARRAAAEFRCHE